MDWSSLVPVTAVIVGYLLSEWSRRRESRSALLRRWDDDRRAVYAEYLGTLDELHDVSRSLDRIEEWLQDPESRVNELLPDLTPEQVENAARRLTAQDQEEREQLWDHYLFRATAAAV